MLKIKGYKFFKTIYFGPKTVVYGGIRIKDNLPVAVKLISEAHLSPQRLKRLAHEYELGRKFNHIEKSGPRTYASYFFSQAGLVSVNRS